MFPLMSLKKIITFVTVAFRAYMDGTGMHGSFPILLASH